MYRIKNDVLFGSIKRSDICKRLWVFIFCRNMRKNINRNIAKNLSSKYSQKRLDHAEQSASDALKTVSKRAEATGSD